MEDLKRKVLEKIKPSPMEKREILNTYHVIKKKIKELDKENKIKKIELVGSVSKDTFLKDNKDLDIFLFFPPSLAKEELEKYTLDIGKKILNDYRIKYAEHPYIKGKYSKYEVEIVPAYIIEQGEKIISAVDRTIFHKEFVLRNLKNPDEVRILKKFMKSIGVYGSELYVRGFSGYACELFIIKYKTFENFINHAASFRKGEVICFTNSCDPHKFKNDPIIMIDPVDPNRNVCSAVSLQNLAKLKFYAKRFISSPNINFFFLDEITLNKDEIIKYHKKLGKYAIIAEFKNQYDELKDTLYPQIEKYRKFLLYLFNLYDFKVERSFSYIDESTYGIYFEYDFKEPTNYRKVSGPSVFSKPNRVKGFITKYDNYWIDEEGILVSNALRKYKTPEEIILSFKEFKEKERHLRGVPKSIARDYETLRIIKDISLIRNHNFFEKYLLDSWKIKMCEEYKHDQTLNVEEDY